MIGTVPLFELDEVSFAVDGHILLHPTSLVLPATRMIGLIGHNGSGKSTMLKLLARQLAPETGQIRFGGAGLAAWPARSLARKIAYLPQSPPAAEGMRVRELIALGRYPWHGAMGRFGQIDRNKVAEAMALTGMETLADRAVDTLSGGERQRAWLAMLVAQDTECLLLDEPISALDIAHQIEVLELVQRLSQQRGLCVVVVLHDVNMAARFCDNIIALHSGRLIAQGSPAELMRAEQLAAIYGVEMGILAHPESGAAICYLR